MGLLSWCSRRVTGLSIVALILLSTIVILNELRTAKSDLGNTVRGSWEGRLLTLVFAYYSLLIHVLVAIFPCRACWALWEVTKDLKDVLHRKKWKELSPQSPQRKLSTYSISSAETRTPSLASSTSSTFSTSSASSILSDTEDLECGYFADAEPECGQHFHTVLIPNYKEDVDTLRETLDVLASHPQARTQYDIYLAMEGREPNSDVKALSLVVEYLKKFHIIDYTVHPGDIPNESPGKSSNISWAARKASERYTDISRDDVIITVIDADSHLSSDYFEEITSMHFKYPETAPTTMYAVPIIFDRNAHSVPVLVRMADIQWCAGGISGLYSRSSIGPPTSVYSLPLGLADKVGGWDTDCEAIGEDLHMYVKCFFALNGNLTRRTVLAPASQTNVSSGLKGTRGVVGDVQARYKQGLRHMWGSLDSGYALRQMALVWRDRKSRIRTFRPLHSSGSHKSEYIPEAELENLLRNQTAGNGFFSDVCYHQVEHPNWSRIFFLLHRLFEAHFLPIHMMVLVIASGIYTLVTRGQRDTLQIAWIFDISGYLRISGFLMVALYLSLYEKFHKVCVNARKAAMEAAGLYDGMQNAFSYRALWSNKLDYIVIPIAAPIFGSLPALQAQMSHFWTLDLAYSVSKKPTKRDVSFGYPVV